MRRALILDAAIIVAQETGLEGWSIDRVARAAGCAKGLVIHHFGSRANLLREAGLVIAAQRAERRLDARRASGVTGLDRLWSVLVADAGAGLSRAAFSLALQGYPTRLPEDPIRFHAAAAACLGIPPDALAAPVALAVMMDGLELQLIGERDRQPL